MKEQIFTPHERRDMRQAARDMVHPLSYSSSRQSKLNTIIDRVKEIDKHADESPRSE